MRSCKGGLGRSGRARATPALLEVQGVPKALRRGVLCAFAGGRCGACGDRAGARGAPDRAGRLPCSRKETRQAEDHDLDPRRLAAGVGRAPARSTTSGPAPAPILADTTARSAMSRRGTSRRGGRRSEQSARAGPDGQPRAGARDRVRGPGWCLLARRSRPGCWPGCSAGRARSCFWSTAAGRLPRARSASSRPGT